MRKALHIFFLLLATASLSYGQPVEELVRRAYIKYNDKDYLGAASDIDEVVHSKEGATNELAWHIRGFVYKDIYVHQDRADSGSEARDVAVFSLQRSMELDVTGNLRENNVKALYYLAGSYWDDASIIIEKRERNNIDKAPDFFKRYLDVMGAIGSEEVNLDEMTIRFYLAMATAHRKIYEQDRRANLTHYEKANKYYLKVLEINPDEWPALYSVAVLYYNDAAYKLERVDDMDIHDVMKVQGESMRSIQFALPFMMRAYEVNPERIEAVKGLKYILFNLHDYEKSEFYEEELQRLESKDK
jgi:tetratricopeptide (TPR) repeat protein